MFPSQSFRSIVVVVSFAIFFAFFTIICATATTEKKYPFHGYDLAVIANTNHTLSYYEEDGGYEVNCEVFPRNLTTTESPEKKPANGSVSDEEVDEYDLPFTIGCSAVLSLGIPGIKCPEGMTRDDHDNCRPIAE